MHVDEGRLRDFLFDTGILSRGELERAAQAARERDTPFAETLVATGVLRDDDMRRALAHVLGVPFVILSRDMLVPDAFSLLPEPFSRAHNAVALGQQGTTLEIALLDIADLPAVQEQVGRGRTVRARLTNRESLMRALIAYQKYLKDSFGASLAAECSRISATGMADAASHDALVRAADVLLAHALHQQAHAVHLEPGEKGVRVRYRTGGGLFDAMTLPSAASALITRFKHLAGLPVGDSVPAVGRFKISHGDGSTVAITVSVAPRALDSSIAEKAVLSFAREDSGKQGLSLSALGVSPANAVELRRAISHRSGLVLVCGEDGGGKTTLLYTLLDELVAPEKNVVSVEHHSSYLLPAVAQMEVREELGLTAASALRAQLRQDADVIMIDCPLDEETVALALNAANRGTLVLMGVVASSAAEGVEQLGALGARASVLASTLLASVYTAAAPKLCRNSRTEHRFSRSEQTTLENSIDIKRVLDELKADEALDTHAGWKDVRVFDAESCSECDSGYAGIIGLQEVLVPTMTLKDDMRGGVSAHEIAAQAREEGMLTVGEDALYKAAQGSVSAETLLAIAGQ